MGIIIRSGQNPQFDKNVDVLKKRINKKTNSAVVIEAVNFIVEIWPDKVKTYEKKIDDLSVFKDRYFKLRDLVLRKQQIENSIIEDVNFRE